MQRPLVKVLVVGAAFLCATSVQAQSIRDAVRDHVSQGLEADRSEPASAEKTPPKRTKRAKRRAPPAADPPQEPATVKPASEVHEASAGGRSNPAQVRNNVRPTSEATAPVLTPPEERLPKRLFGKGWEFDAKIGAGIRGWYPEQYPLVSVDHASYLTWSLDLKAKLFGFLRLHRGYYESNGLRGPRSKGAVIARDVGRLVPKAAWVLGTLGVPLSRRWETVVSYESRAFVTSAHPTAPVAIASRKTSPGTDLSQLPRSAGALEFVSGFETLVLGARYFPERGNAGLVGDTNGRIPPMYFGIGFTQYSKPYQVHVGADDPLDEILFDGRFRGAGLAYGLATSRQVDTPFVTLDSQLGIGEVSLLEHLTLNELLPEDWLIGYLQGNVTFGYILPLLRTRPTPLLAGELMAGGATFFYFQTKDSDTSPPTLPLNWDLFWAAHVSLTLPL